MEYYACCSIMFVQIRGWAKIYCLTVCSRNCGRVKVSVNECTAQLADSAEFVRVGSVWRRSCVPLKMFHMWDFPAVNIVLQHTCCSSAHLLYLQVKSSLPNTVCFIYVATTTEQHNGYGRNINVCCLNTLPCKISNELDVDILGEWYKNELRRNNQQDAAL